MSVDEWKAIKIQIDIGIGDLEKYRNPFRNKRLVDILSEYEAENLADTINKKPSQDEGFFISTMCAVLIYAVFRLNRSARIRMINTNGSK